MKFFNKLGKVFANNIVCTIVLIVALVCFFYFSRDLIAGLFTVVSALVIYICVGMLVQAYKNISAVKTKTVTKKATSKKVSKKK